MKVAPVASDVADGIRQNLSGIQGLTLRDVQVSGSTITAIVPGASGLLKQRVQSVLDGYRDSGFTIGFDTRAGA